ncbi:MAG: translation elongation factor-like protein [Candidatus Omnitrophica bacterium]|nr:translation elongation factor-like protein [Candidatus Omnitrophota bacterium]
MKKIEGTVIGAITHYFPKVRAAVIKLKAPLNTGDMIRVKGHTTDFKQAADSLQIDRVPVASAKKGDEIGLLVDSRVRQHDTVYKI